MKNFVGLFIVGCFAIFLTSCLGGDDDTETNIYKNCQIRSFTLESDSIKGLSSVKFTIDQYKGEIYNMDSLAYGTKVEKLICTIQYISELAVGGIQVMQQAVGDTIWWNAQDSIDFSQPVKFVLMAYDGMSQKDYKAWVNVHTVHPDSMVWSQYASILPGVSIKEQKVIGWDHDGEPNYFMYVRTTSTGQYSLYRSPINDLKTWTEMPLSGLPESNVPLAQITEFDNILYAPSTDGNLYLSTDGIQWKKQSSAPSVCYLMGIVKEGQNQPSVMAGIVRENDQLRFASMNMEKEWTTGEAVPDLFPITGFGVNRYHSMYHEYLLLAAGRDKNNELLNNSWATMDGRNWAMLTANTADYYDKREGVVLTEYDDKLFLTGGLLENGRSASSEIYTSIDKGITWAEADSLMDFPETFLSRGFSSVIVDEEQYMLLFGGKTRSNYDERNEIWRGRINRFGFKK